MSNPDLCISLISTNTATLLRDCLHSIYDEPPRAQIETWVVDNASTDETAAMLRNEFPDVHVIRNQERRGYGANHNVVFEKSTARFILVLNEDTKLRPDTIDSMLLFMERTPDAGIASCKVFFGDGRLQQNAGRFPSLMGEFLHFGLNITKHGKGWYYRRKFLSNWSHNETRKVDWVSGCLFLVRREVFDQIGGFHKDIFIYFEDAELCLRMLRRTEYRTYYFAETSIVHYHGQSFDPMKFSREYFAFNGSCVFFRSAYGRRTEITYRVLCRFLWSTYLLVIKVVLKIIRGHSSRLERKKSFYRFLLSEGEIS